MGKTVKIVKITHPAGCPFRKGDLCNIIDEWEGEPPFCTTKSFAKFCPLEDYNPKAVKSVETVETVKTVKSGKVVKEPEAEGFVTVVKLIPEEVVYECPEGMRRKFVSNKSSLLVMLYPERYRWQGCCMNCEHKIRIPTQSDKIEAWGCVWKHGSGIAFGVEG